MQERGAIVECTSCLGCWFDAVEGEGDTMSLRVEYCCLASCCTYYCGYSPLTELASNDNILSEGSVTQDSARRI